MGSQKPLFCTAVFDSGIDKIILAIYHKKQQHFNKGGKMFGSEILEVAIGLIFFYILLSLICSAINEWISRIFALRAKNLEKAIYKLLDDSKDKKLTKEFYKHPLIEVLAEKSWLDKLFKREARPSYIPKEYFPKAFLSALDIDDSQVFAVSRSIDPTAD